MDFKRLARPTGRERHQSVEPADQLDSAALSDPLAAPIQRKASGVPATAGHDAMDAATSSGAGEIPFRSQMESSFGQDFGSVRAFTGKSSEADSLGAEAATRGNDVVFADSSPSAEVVGHELAHVVQNRIGSAPTGGGPIAPSDSPAESEAHAAGSQAAAGGSATVSGGPSAAIHLRKKPGATVEIPSICTRSGLDLPKKGGTSTAAVLNWLDAMEKHSDKEGFDHALSQALDATEYWIAKHDSEDKNYAKMTALFKALHGVQQESDTPTVPPVAPLSTSTLTDEEVEAPTGYDVAESVSGVGPSSIEKIGQGVDMHGEESHYGKVQGPKVDILEGTMGVMGGGTEMVLGHHKLKEQYLKHKSGETVDKGKLVEGTLDTTSGVMMTTSGITKVGGGIKDLKDKSSGHWSDVSESTGGIGSIIGVISEIKSLVDDTKEYTEKKDKTEDEKLLFKTNTTQSVVSIGRGITDTVTAFLKVAKESAKASSKVSGALGVVMGTLDIIEGGYQSFTAHQNKGDMDSALESVRSFLVQLQIKHGQAQTDYAKAKGLELKRKTPDLETVKNAFEPLIQALADTVARLESDVKELSAAVEMMKKVQTRRMKTGVLKGVTGTLDVVTGGLMLSGVGAPVAITLAALSALLKLGNVGVGYGRQWKANKLTQTALRLTEGGMPKGKPDTPDTVKYGDMKRRVYAAYYANYYPHAFHDSQPPEGLDLEQWTHVRTFVLEEKLEKVKEKQTLKMKKGEVAGKSRGDLEGVWGVVTEDGTDKVIETEYPSTKRKLKIKFSFSAHESKSGRDFSNEQLANIMVQIAKAAYDPSTKKFVDQMVLGTGTPDPEEKSKAVKSVIGQSLLKSVGITETLYTSMWKTAGGDFGDPTGSPATPPSPPPDEALVKAIKAKIGKYSGD